MIKYDKKEFTFIQQPDVQLTIWQKDAFEDAGDILFVGRRKGVKGLDYANIKWKNEGIAFQNRKIYSAKNVHGWNKVISFDFPRSIGGEWSLYFAKEGLVYTAIGQWSDSLQGKRIGFLPMGCRENDKIVKIMVKGITDIAKWIHPMQFSKPTETKETHVFLYSLSDADILQKAFTETEEWQ